MFFDNRKGITFSDAVAKLADTLKTDPGKRMLEFIRADSKRGFAGGPRQNSVDSK